MTRPRATLVSPADTPYYHCIGRCVRRAFLVGEDIVTGKSFSHRSQWMLDRLKLLTDTFAIGLCAHALMSMPLSSRRAHRCQTREALGR